MNAKKAIRFMAEYIDGEDRKHEFLEGTDCMLQCGAPVASIEL